MTPQLEADLREFLLRCIREHEEEWLAIEAESLLKRMKDEKSCPRCRRAMDPTREFCPRCGEAYQPNSGSDPEHRWPY